MPSLKVFFSNQLELLAEQLSQIVRLPLSSALAPETIIVQSRGMERWLSMALAEHNGIAANCRFPFPNAFLADLFKQIIPRTTGMKRRNSIAAMQKFLFLLLFIWLFWLIPISQIVP